MMSTIKRNIDVEKCVRVGGAEVEGSAGGAFLGWTMRRQAKRST